eukprot:1845332-Prorocentrum_lima.AAC.1
MRVTRRLDPESLAAPGRGRLDLQSGVGEESRLFFFQCRTVFWAAGNGRHLSLIHISEPTRLDVI